MDTQDKLQVPGEFRVIDYDVPGFIGDYASMDYGDPTALRMVELREEFELENIVAGCESEFDGFLALKRWVRSRWNHGWSDSFGTVKDGLDILREAALLDKKFCCGHYARVFTDCATALGWPARRIGIAIADCEFPRDHNVGNVGHAVLEIWSNEHRKWVVMDPDLNVHYEREGRPLSALEIGQAWLSGAAKEVDMVEDEPKFVTPDGTTLHFALETCPGLNEFDEETVRLNFERFNRHRAIDYYARLRIAGWEWVDARCPPTFVSHFHPAPGGRWTSNAADMYWSLNMTGISTTPSWGEDGARLKIGLEHCAPFFDHYEMRVDGGDWEPCEPGFDWAMHEGRNSLECRSVNVMNRPGIVSRIEVAYARPRW